MSALSESVAKSIQAFQFVGVHLISLHASGLFQKFKVQGSRFKLALFPGSPHTQTKVTESWAGPRSEANICFLLVAVVLILKQTSECFEPQLRNFLISFCSHGAVCS